MSTVSLASVINAPSQTTSLDSLISGEDQTNNWMQMANGANQYYFYRPLVVLDPDSFGTINTSPGLLIGTTGSTGDYLDKLIISISNPTQSRVALQDEAAVSYTSAGNTTAFTNATTINFGLGTTTLTVAQGAELVGAFLICTATISGTSVQIARKIMGAGASAGSSPNYYVTLTLDTLTVAGVAATAIGTTAGQAFISELIEIVPAGINGFDTVNLGVKSKYGGWRIFIDSGVSVIATGKFS